MAEQKNLKIRLRVAGLFMHDGKILTVQHRRGQSLHYLLPGGQINYGEAAQDALCREFREELCCSATPGDLAFITETIEPNGERQVIQMVFYVQLDPRELAIGEDPAVVGFEFINSSQLKGLEIYPDQKQILASILEKGPSPANYYWLPWKPY